MSALSDLGSRTVSVGTLVIASCWLVGSALVVVACLGMLAAPWSVAGVALLMLGCTATVVGAIRGQERRVRDAFDMGRESVRLVGR